MERARVIRGVGNFVRRSPGGHSVSVRVVRTLRVRTSPHTPCAGYQWGHSFSARVVRTLRVRTSPHTPCAGYQWGHSFSARVVRTLRVRTSPHTECAGYQRGPTTDPRRHSFSARVVRTLRVRTSPHTECVGYQWGPTTDPRGTRSVHVSSAHSVCGQARTLRVRVTSAAHLQNDPCGDAEVDDDSEHIAQGGDERYGRDGRVAFEPGHDEGE